MGNNSVCKESKICFGVRKCMKYKDKFLQRENKFVTKQHWLFQKGKIKDKLNTKLKSNKKRNKILLWVVKIVYCYKDF